MSQPTQRLSAALQAPSPCKSLSGRMLTCRVPETAGIKGCEAPLLDMLRAAQRLSAPREESGARNRLTRKGIASQERILRHRQTLRPAQRCTVTARPQDFAPLIPRGSAHACTPSSCSRPHARAAPAPCGCRSQPPVGASRTSDAYAALGIIVIMPTAGLCRCHDRGLRSSKGWMARWHL
jgi:hypothetical protein